MFVLAYKEVIPAYEKEFYGDSTDTKPTLEAKNVGSTFYEDDTGDIYTFTTDLVWVVV